MTDTTRKGASKRSVEPCVIEVDGLLDPDCGVAELGSTVRFVERQPDPDPEPQPEPEPVMSATPAPAPAPEVPEVPVSPPATTESVGVAGDIAAVTDAVGDLGLGPASPVVIIALAAIVVLGGTKGWAFWRQRSEQGHAMAMKRLEMEQTLAAKGAETSSPKACRLIHDELKTKIAAMKAKEVGQEARLDATERKLQLLAGIDPADVDRQIKRVALHADEVDESVVRLARRVKGLEEVGE